MDLPVPPGWWGWNLYLEYCWITMTVGLSGSVSQKRRPAPLSDTVRVKRRVPHPSYLTGSMIRMNLKSVNSTRGNVRTRRLLVLRWVFLMKSRYSWKTPSTLYYSRTYISWERDDERNSELRHVTSPFPVSPVPALAGEVAHRSEPTG